MSTLPRPHDKPVLLFYLFGDQVAMLSDKLSGAGKASRSKYLIKYFKPYYSLLPYYDEKSKDCMPVEALYTDWYVPPALKLPCSGKALEKLLESCLESLHGEKCLRRNLADIFFFRTTDDLAGNGSYTSTFNPPLYLTFCQRAELLRHGLRITSS
jgi:hypothetical protein